MRGQAELGHPEGRTPGTLGAGWPDSSTLLALGRAIFGGFFLYNGLNHFASREMMTGYARSKGVPLAGAAVAGSGLLLTAGGLSILSGVRPKFGSACIAAFLLGVTPMMHDFWNMEDEGQRTSELINFSKNVALLGGASLAAAVPEPWPYSLQLPGEAAGALTTVVRE